MTKNVNRSQKKFFICNSVVTKVCCRPLLCTTYRLAREVPDNQRDVGLAVCKPHDHAFFDLCKSLTSYCHELRLSRLCFPRWFVACTRAKNERFMGAEMAQAVCKSLHMTWDRLHCGPLFLVFCRWPGSCLSYRRGRGDRAKSLKDRGLSGHTSPLIRVPKRHHNPPYFSRKRAFLPGGGVSALPAPRG